MKTQTFLFLTNKDSEAGYTLLELLVVLAVVALVMAATPTLYARMVPNFQVRQFASDVAVFARKARERARQSQKVTGFQHSSSAKILVSLDEELAFPGGIEVEFERPVAWTNVDENKVEFYPGGGSSGGTFEITRGRVKAEVVIDWVSGAVKIIQ